jgi:hypothetical protein
MASTGRAQCGDSRPMAREHVGVLDGFGSTVDVANASLHFPDWREVKIDGASRRDPAQRTA